jgi:hypothetical protein
MPFGPSYLVQLASLSRAEAPSTQKWTGTNGSIPSIPKRFNFWFLLTNGSMIFLFSKTLKKFAFLSSTILMVSIFGLFVLSIWIHSVHSSNVRNFLNKWFYFFSLKHCLSLFFFFSNYTINPSIFNKWLLATKSKASSTTLFVMAFRNISCCFI